jgi:hypothetical protein
MGVSQARVSQMERGDIEKMQVESVAAIGSYRDRGELCGDQRLMM